MSKKVLLKLSGEFFKGNDDAIDIAKIQEVAQGIHSLREHGMHVAVVVGAGNIFRGRSVAGLELDRAISDYIGMLGCVINGAMLKNVLQSMDIPVRLESMIDIGRIAENHNPDKARTAFAKGEVLIFGGTGLPYFSTDTAAVIFALELGVDVLLKGTKVDGVYDADPEKNPSAKKFETLTYEQALADRLQVVDGPAFALAQEHGLEMLVFKWSAEAVDAFARGEVIGTKVFTANN